MVARLTTVDLLSNTTKCKHDSGRTSYISTPPKPWWNRVKLTPYSVVIMPIMDIGRRNTQPDSRCRLLTEHRDTKQ